MSPAAAAASSSPYVESKPEALVLRYAAPDGQEASLDIRLDLFELLQNLARGLCVPETLSRPLTWCLARDEGRSGLASGCARALPSGTVSTCVNAIRLPGGAAHVRLARLARPVRPRQGRRDPDPAPPGRRPSAPGQGPAAVLGRPSGASRADPAAVPQPALPTAADHLPADPAALSRRSGQAALDQPALRSRTSPDRGVRAGAGAGNGSGQPGLGLPAHPRRAGRPGPQARALNRMADSEGCGH